MESMQRMQLFLLTAVACLTFSMTPQALAQAAPKSSSKATALSKSLHDVYLYWRKAMVAKDYNAWKKITAGHRKIAIQNRIVSEKGKFPADIFKVPSAPPSLDGLKLIRARSKGATAKLVYFGKVNFGIGGEPSDNLFVLSFVHDGPGWKYDTAEFVNLGGLKDVRAQLKAGKLSYVDGEAFLPSGVKPRTPIVVRQPKYIAKVYTFCPGREVRVTMNKVSSHRFQDTQQSEVVIGGARDGINEIRYTIKNLPGYKGDDPMTIRIYIFSQINGVKPVKVFEYQTVKGEKPKLSSKEMFRIDPADGEKVLGR